ETDELCDELPDCAGVVADGLCVPRGPHAASRAATASKMISLLLHLPLLWSTPRRTAVPPSGDDRKRFLVTILVPEIMHVNSGHIQRASTDCTEITAQSWMACQRGPSATKGQEGRCCGSRCLSSHGADWTA